MVIYTASFFAMIVIIIAFIKTKTFSNERKLINSCKIILFLCESNLFFLIIIKFKLSEARLDQSNFMSFSVFGFILLNNG